MVTENEDFAKNSKLAAAKLRTKLKLPENKLDELITAPVNSGFAGMNNLAIKKTIRKYKADFYLLINDDAKVKANFFGNFVKIVKAKSKKNKKAAQQKFSKMTASKLKDFIVPLVYEGESEIVDSYGVEYFKSGYAKNCTSRSLKTTLASASCLLVSGQFLQKMQQKYGFYFNSLLFYYLEDVEFMIRAYMLGARIKKSSKLVVFHEGSVTSGKKSYFTMYQTYRNILWLIILSWPLRSIVKHLGTILLVQAWVIVFSFRSFGPLLYLRLMLDTIRNLRKLFEFRKKTVPNYKKGLDFEAMLSKHAFRTYHGITIL